MGIIAVNQLCGQKLQGSTDSSKISEKTIHPAGAMCTGKRQTHIRNAPSSRTAVTGIALTTGACKFALHIHKNILPSRRFGTRAYLLRGATQIRKRLDTSLLRKGCGLRGPGDFGAVRLIRLLGGCPSRCCCKGLSASWPSLWAGRKPVLLPRRRKNQNYRIVFLFFIIMRQSRSPRCNPRISISAEARFVAHGTLDESHRRSVRMMR